MTHVSAYRALSSLSNKQIVYIQYPPNTLYFISFHFILLDFNFFHFVFISFHFNSISILFYLSWFMCFLFYSICLSFDGHFIGQNGDHTDRWHRQTNTQQCVLSCYFLFFAIFLLFFTFFHFCFIFYFIFYIFIQYFYCQA